MAFAGGSFATFLIIGPTCFFLGIVFSLLPYDYPLLWSPVATPVSHFEYLEAHLRFLHASPLIVPRILHSVIGVGLIGLIMKLYKPSESNMLFDGASLVLYMCGIIVYVSNIVKGLRLVTEGDYGASAEVSADDENTGQILGREDSLKVMAASNTILALVLVGVLVLQAGQWYAEKKDRQESESFKQKDKEREEKEKEKEEKGKESPRVTRQSSAATKKKQ